MIWRWANDRWLSREYTFAKDGILTYDKLQHFLGGALFAIFNLWFSLAFWFLWEVKDALFPWENDRYITRWPIHYNWGGDGFSWRDMLAAWFGAGLIYLLKGLIYA
jgi:hypothetical protein